MARTVDFVVVGSGIAGLTFACKASPLGHVLVLTKKHRAESNTNYAQGGIAAVFGRDDSIQLHVEDTLRAGDGLSHADAVQIMAREGPPLVKELHDMGCRFNLSSDGSFDLGREGGHSRRRIVHAKDYTGYEIERVLLDHARQLGVEITENDVVLDLWVDDNRCRGLYYYDARSNRIDTISASATILATGGVGQLYEHTTNPPIATGDGIAMAYRAGARIANMEFVQFHPTAVYSIKLDGRSFLITEAVRGEGGVLKTASGVSFMEAYHPSGNLAPRDVVARACVQEMLKSGDDYVLLDLTHLDPEFAKNRFPTIYETCLRWGIDFTREPIPVVPAAHYLCGGILVNTWAESSLPGLFALGECSCTGVHGANRLASNSLLEALVFATRAAQRVATHSVSVRADQPVPAMAAKPGPEVRLKLQELMSRSAGVIRTTASLASAAETLERWSQDFAPGIHVINAESRNMCTVAQLILTSCLTRKESRGLHYIRDYPERNDAYLRDTVVTMPR